MLKLPSNLHKKGSTKYQLKPYNFFRINKPCKDCPFKKDTLKSWLGGKRAKEIVTDLSNHSFICHKTLNRDLRNRRTEAHCAGAILMQINQQHHTKNPLSRTLQIAERLNLLNLSYFSKTHELNRVFDSFDDFIKHHE